MQTGKLKHLSVTISQLNFKTVTPKTNVHSFPCQPTSRNPKIFPVLKLSPYHDKVWGNEFELCKHLIFCFEQQWNGYLRFKKSGSFGRTNPQGGGRSN